VVLRETFMCAVCAQLNEFKDYMVLTTLSTTKLDIYTCVSKGLVNTFSFCMRT
jgi:hypothetical protein